MEPHTLTSAQPLPEQTLAQAMADVNAPAARLDLSRMEPPKRLAEARLEEVTIDGICGVY